MTRPPVTQRAFGSRFVLAGDVVETALYDEHAARDVEAGVPVALWIPRPALFADPVARERLRRASVEIRRVIHPRVRRMFAVGDAPAPWVTYQPAAPLRLTGTVARDQLVPWLDAVAGALVALHAAGLVHGGVLAADVVAVDGEIRIGGGGVWACADPAALAATARDAPLAPERRRGAPATAVADAWSLAHLIAGWAGAGPDPLAAVQHRHPALAAELAPALAADPAARRHDLIELAAAARAALATPFTDERPGGARRPRRRKKQTTEERTAVGHASGHAPIDEPTERTAPPVVVVPAPAAPLLAVSMKPGGPRTPRPDTPTPPPPTPQLQRAVIRHSTPAPDQETSGSLGRLAPPRAIVEAERRSRRRIWIFAGLAIAVVVAAVLTVLVVR